MSADLLEHALILVSQGKTHEAQNLLKPLITSDPRNVAAWLLLVETCPTNDLRLKTLEHCLTYNPDNLQIRRSLEELQSTIKEESNVFSVKKELLASSRLSDEQRQESNQTVYSNQGLGVDASLKKVTDEPLPSRKALIIKMFGWFIILNATIIGSIAVRLSVIGFYLVIFGIFLLIPIAVHFFVHLCAIVFADIDSPKVAKTVLSSHLLLFLCFLTQLDSSANAFTQILASLGFNVPWALVDFSSDLSYVFAIGLIISWIVVWRNMDPWQSRRTAGIKHV